MQTSIFEKDYWKIVCESDAAWELFCKYPQDATWKNYEETKKKELKAFERLSKTEKIKVLND